MNKFLNIAAIFNSIGLFIFGLILFLFLMASTHVNLQDYAQLKYILEVVVFVFGSILLLVKRNHLEKFNWVLFSILLLIVASFFDLYFEVLTVDYSKDVPLVILLLLCLILIINLMLLIFQIRKFLRI